MRKLVLFATHGAMLLVGFAAGIYALPILTAPPPPATSDILTATDGALYEGEFRRDLADSDFLHWGEGRVIITSDRVALMGEIAPGPDYRLYFSPEFIETEDAFERLKPRMAEAGPIRTFSNFVVDVPASIDPDEYNSVVVWCESFGQFITATRYR